MNAEGRPDAGSPHQVPVPAEATWETAYGSAAAPLPERVGLRVRTQVDRAFDWRVIQRAALRRYQAFNVQTRKQLATDALVAWVQRHKDDRTPMGVERIRELDRVVPRRPKLGRGTTIEANLKGIVQEVTFVKALARRTEVSAHGKALALREALWETLHEILCGDGP